MEIESYLIGKTTWFLAKNKQNYNRLSYDTSSLKLSNDYSHSTYPYQNIVGNVEFKEGLIWSALFLELSNGTVIKFDWINKKAAEQLQSDINIEIYKFYKKIFKEASQQIVEVFRQLEVLYKQDCYLKYSSTQDWIGANRDITGLLAREERANYLDKQTNRYADELSNFFSHTEKYRNERNKFYVENKKATYKTYFDNLESNFLTDAQRNACIEDEGANLVLAGAGTGKTSTIVGKAGYLIETNSASPDEILMLAFARKAADEMEERVEGRIGCEKLTVKTFHGLGKEIIAKVERKQPSLSKMAEDDKAREKFVDSVLSELIQTSSYREKLVNYFANYLYPVKNVLDFKTKKDYIEYCQQVELRTLKGELVKSHEELMIANYLYQQGVNYEYESDYIINTAGPDFRKYKPDFYLTDYGVYIEHFALDKNGKAPKFMGGEKYLASAEWKRALHEEHGTKLIETYSYEHQQGRLLDNLKEKLITHNVVFQPIPDNQLLDFIKELGGISSFSRLIVEFLKLFKSTLLSIQELYEKAAGHIDKARMLIVVELFEPIYQKYQSYLESRNEIDFEDMIAKAVSYVEEGLFVSPYRYVLVDEFQDISAPRARLVKALQHQNKDNSIFCVGDDWQSIYRFTGSDVTLTHDFTEHFGVAAINILDMTFRFNQKIGEVAAKFIQNNPAQIKKDIKSFREVNDNAVSIVPSKTDAEGLELALQALDSNAKVGSSVLVLGRFSYIKPKNYSNLKRIYSNLNIDYMTVHGSKGKEADYVIVLGLVTGKNGFPSSKVSNSILSLLLPTEESYQYAEERRLFYVALTRARHYVYLVTHPEKSSSFVRELRKNNYPVSELVDGKFNNKEWGKEIECPECQSGYLVGRKNRTNGKVFYACNNYPYCDYTQNGCPKCGDHQVIKSDHLICSSDKCDCVEPLCPECGTVLKLKSGRNGKFWGCSRYRKDSDFSCTYTINYIDLEKYK
ncbi:MAG: UvrD-helicase domain-containing protein [Gammaproteobacteria bacterium]|jgi:DNA helicase-4